VRFTQADVARCIRAAQQCGASHVLILPDGTIEIRLQSSMPSNEGVREPVPRRRPGETFGSYFRQPEVSQTASDPLTAAFGRFMRGEIRINQLPPGRYPNGVYADGEWEAIVRSRPLGKREMTSLKAYFDADGASNFYSGGPETNERLLIRGLIEISGRRGEGREPYYQITTAGRTEWRRVGSDAPSPPV
jgi:hypothetical protein